MLQVWLRAQNSPLAVWHADSKQWQTVDNWQQLYDTYFTNHVSAHVSANTNDNISAKKGYYKNNSHKTICLYFPSTYALQVDTELNATQLKQLGTSGKQYLFEENSLTAVEQLAVRQTGSLNNYYLYALAKSDIETWQQSAALVGLNISALLPDFLLLPSPEEGAGQQIVLYRDSYTTLLRQSLYQGLAVSYLPLILERLPHLSEVCRVPAIEELPHLSDESFDNSGTNINTNINNSASLSLQKANLLNAELTTDDTQNTVTEIVALMSAQQILLTTLSAVPTPIEHPERHALNFFTKSSSSQISPYLKVAMMVALSALVLQIVTDSVQWYRYQQAATSTQTAIAAQYQSWFPNEPLNPRTKLQTQLQPKLRSDSQNSSSHLAMLARISPLIKQSSLQAQALVMQPTALSFTLIAADRNSLDQFTNTLLDQGIAATLERVNSNEQGQFSGQITVNIIDKDNNESSQLAS